METHVTKGSNLVDSTTRHEDGDVSLDGQMVPRKICFGI